MKSEEEIKKYYVAGR